MTTGSYEFDPVNDAVAEKDLYTEKTHEKVAETLFHLMRSSESGLTVGLEGSWGSGKSTVVKFLKSKLEKVESPNTLVFLFDAWAHEGDPLRRIFLERLISQIDPKANNKELRSLLNEISGRKKIVKVSSKKKTSLLGSLLSLAAFLVPTGAAFIAVSEPSNLVPAWSSSAQTFNVLFSAGLTMTLSPPIVLLCWFLFGMVRFKCNLRKIDWGIFASETKEDYTQDITEDGERTSIEFEHYFKAILSQSVGNDKKYQRALIVVDNLDRVEPEEATAIWSVLQTFFQTRSNSDEASMEDWAKRLWFLVPYDREGLSRIWDKTNSPSRVFKAEEHASDPTKIYAARDQQSSPVAFSFMEKCFQVIADVPEPVISEWIDYCEKVVEASLSSWEKEARKEIINTYRRYESSLDSSPTPRKIKIFVNQVGIQGLRWGNDMSAEAIALFVLLKQKHSGRELREKLLSSGLPDNYISESDDYELKTELAGMLFGVDKGKGIQILLQPSIHSALLQGHSEEIEALITEHGPAFWVVWEAVRGQELPNGNIDEYLISATSAICKGANSHRSRISKDISHLANQWQSASIEWKFEKHDYAQSLASLIPLLDERSPFIDQIKVAIDKILKSMLTQTGKEDFNPSGLHNMSKAYELVGEYKAVEPTRYPLLTIDKWTSWTEGLESEDAKLPHVWPAKDAISKATSHLNVSGPDKQVVKSLIVAVNQDPKNAGWKEVSARLIAWGEYDQRDPNQEHIYKLMLEMFLKCEETISKSIGDCIKGADFWYGSAEDELQLVPSLLALSVIVHGSELQKSNVDQSFKDYWKKSASIDENDPVISTLIVANQAPILWELSTDSKNELAINLVKTIDARELYEGTSVVEYLDELGWAEAEDLKKVVANISKYDTLEKATNVISKDPVLYRECLFILQEYGDEKTRSTVNTLISAVTKEQWTDSFGKDNVLFNCLNVKGNHNFKDSFLEVVLAELDSAEPSSKIWSIFDLVVEKLQDSEIVLEKIMTQYFARETDVISDEVFNALSSNFSSIVSSVNSTHALNRLELWIMNSQWERIRWLLESKWEFDGDVSESLVSRAKELFPEENNENKSTIAKLATALNFDLEEPPESSDESSIE